MKYSYKRIKVRNPRKAVDLLEKELRAYRGGLITSSMDAGKEHPLHFAVRQVEAFRLRHRNSANDRQPGVLAYPVNIYWYALLSWSRQDNKKKALRCRDRILSMLNIVLDGVTGVYPPFRYDNDTYVKVFKPSDKQLVFRFPHKY